MKVEWRREPQSRAVLEVEVPADEVVREVRASATRLAQRVRVPGFRPGKAPRAVLERYIGRDELYGEAAEALVTSAYRQAVSDVGVLPVGRPEFDVPPLDEAQPLRFVARVDVAPEVDPGAYDEVRIPYQPPAVTDADVDAAIEDLRRRRGRLVSVPDAKAAPGDFVLVRPVSVEGTDRFQVGREVLVELGEGVFPPELEKALEGTGTADERSVTFGEAAKVTVTVADVKQRELPTLDDAFAKSLDVASVDELRTRLRERLTADSTAAAEEAYEDQLLTAVLERATIELPGSLVEHEIEHLVEDLNESLQRRGYTLARYLEGAGKDMAGLRGELRPRAERRLRARFLLDEIARREGLVPTQEEIVVEEEKVAAELKQDLARVREWLDGDGRREAMLTMLRRRKTVATLMARAKGVAAGSAGG